MKIYILILIISGGSRTGKTSINQEFNSLAQCQYTYKILSEQTNKAYSSSVIAGDCFEK